MTNKTQPQIYICCACMKAKQTSSTRQMLDGEMRTYENFFYSEEHRGWICKSCSAVISAAISKPKSKSHSGQRDFFKEDDRLTW